MQSSLFIITLVLQPERLMRILVNPLVLFQATLGGVFAVPQQVASFVVGVTAVEHGTTKVL